jgi:hypothetical protein
LQTSRPNTSQIVQPYVIRPSSGNSGNHYFYAANVGGITGASTPIWCQTQGCTVTDGTVTWYNVNKLGSITIPAAENMWLLNAYVGDAGNATISTFPNFQASNVRIDGQLTTTPYCNSNHIVGLHIQQGYFLNAKTDGLHITNCENQSITNAYIGGESYNPASATPDRGGLILDGVYTSTFSDLNFEYNTRSAIQLINATQSNAFSNVHINNSVGDAISSPYNYGLYMDGTSFSNSFSNLFIQGNSTNAHGIYGSAGPSNFVHNYVPSGTNAGTLTFDTLGAVVLTNASGRQANVPVEFDVNGASALAIDSTGKVMVGELSVRDIPGHEYFVSKFANIQAAIDAAYNNGTVQGGATVIDDRLAPYSGAGFIVKDSVTLKLAATTYTITGTVTYNNGVGNVTAGIISMPGSHIVGVGTSSNHGTIVSAGAGLSADLIASSTLGTGTGTNAQWWHWGSIESLNINGASQASGRCLVVENMGETARVENILARSCYGNNIEIIGSSASQSSIRNITTMRSQTASGMRFTNLSGVGKVDGLSGDCNPTSLVSVQENAAGSLTILGLKAEGEASICTGTVHDPVVLLDGVAGFNDHVRIIGGYAFGTAQGSFAKFVNTGNAILETEGLYITGYTNMLNDTVRGVTVPLSSSMSKQPFYYEPGGTTYANQAFTLTGGTFVQGQPATTPTEIFGLTTGSATLLAAAGNGDNSSILTGGIQISGQNRAQYGTPPEIMARWGYRWLGAGLGYDTTNFDLVPAWNSGDTSSRNLGNALTVCKKGSTTVSCRWPNIYALNVDTASLTLNGSAVTIPTAGATTPNMDGTGAAGSSGNYARADHVHPTDVSRVATASVTAYGSCGDSTHVCQMTTNSQGLVTNESAVAIAAGAASIPYWSNQVAAGGSIAMSGAANKVYCYGIRIDQPITVTSVGMFVGTGDGTGNYSVQIFPPGSNQLPVFSSTAVHVSAAAGAEQQFSQPGNATWAATPGIYQMCTTGSAVTATMKGSASPMWNYYSQPSGLTSSGGLISGTLSSAVAPTFLNTAPTVVMH